MLTSHTDTSIGQGHTNPSLRASTAVPYIVASRSRPQNRLAELLQRGLRLAGTAVSQGRAVGSTGRPLWLGQREAVAAAGPAASDSGERAAARGVLGPRGWSRGGTSPGPDGVFGSSRGAGRAGSPRGPLRGPGRAGGTRGSGRAGPFLLRQSPPALPVPQCWPRGSRLCSSCSPLAPCRLRRCPCAAGPRSAPRAPSREGSGTERCGTRAVRPRPARALWSPSDFLAEVLGEM